MQLERTVIEITQHGFVIRHFHCQVMVGPRPLMHLFGMTLCTAFITNTGMGQNWA